MTIERLEKEISKVDEQIQALVARRKDLVDQKTMAEDAASIKVIRKLKISPEKLQLLNKLSEDEISRLLRQKEEERFNHDIKQSN